MRFVLALVALVIAVALGGFGIAQRTILSGPDSLTATTSSTSDAPVTVVSGETLNALDGRQRLEISGSDTIFAAYARTTDVLAWIGDANYNEITFDPETSEITSTESGGDEATVPAPAGSDLWLLEYTGESQLDIEVSLDEEFSFIIVSDGTAAAPSDISLTWPLDNRTPLAGPFMAGGVVMLVVAFAFLIWALVNRRRTRGPRRKSIRGPKTPRMPRLPRQRSYRVRKPAAIGANRGRRSTRRMTAVIPVFLIGALALSGCSADMWPRFDTDAQPSASPSPSSSVAVDPVEEVAPPVATVRQVQAIVKSVATVAETADATLDQTAIAARFAGAALELRTGIYKIKAADSAYPAPVPIPTGSIEVTLPEQSTTWPRVVFAVAASAPDTSTDPPTQAAPVALTLIQNSPREQYKVTYAQTFEANAVLPELAPETVGAPRLGPDTKLLSLAPSGLAAAYVDVLTTGETSASYPLFDIVADGLIPLSGVEARTARIAALDAKAALSIAITASDVEPIVMLSNDSGALVSIYVNETETVTPVEAEATISPEGATKTLIGVAGTTKGWTATYGDQLLFYIPPIGSTDKIVLLGFTQGLVSAKEIE